MAARSGNSSMLVEPPATSKEPDYAPHIRAQIIDADVARMRRDMMVDKVEDITSQVSPETAEGGGFAKTTERGREKVTIYHVQSGQPSQCLYYQLSAKLRMEDVRGKSVWTLRQSEAASPKHGKILCSLHPDHENREYYDSIGLEGIECTKANLPTSWQLRRHMELKHKAQWEAIREEEDRLRRDEDRDLAKRNLAAMERLAQGQAALAS